MESRIMESRKGKERGWQRERERRCGAEMCGRVRGWQRERERERRCEAEM